MNESLLSFPADRIHARLLQAEPPPENHPEEQNRTSLRHARLEVSRHLLQTGTGGTLS